MLQSLQIRNLALLEEVALDFEAGFTVVTGETGAGKSILLGALSLLAGERADKGVIRQGAAACEVEASLFFKDAQRIDAMLESLGLPQSEEGLLVLKRSVSREKAPRLLVNGSLATLAAFQALGECWIDFHGPNEPRRLLKEACQLELLDLFARSGAVLESYRSKYREWRARVSERDRVLAETRLSPEQIQYLENQLARLDALDLSEEAIEALERSFQRLNRSQEIIERAMAIAAGLSGEEGAGLRIAALVREAKTLESIDPSSGELAGRLAAASVELGELSGEFERLAQELSFEPEEVEAVTARMNAWLDAQRKHGREIPAVAAAREDLRRRLEVQGDLDGTLARLESEIVASHRAAIAEASQLRRLREKGARELSRIAAKEIAGLGFRKADFLVRLVPLEDLGPDGDCRVEFLFSPNVGEAPLPLNRIASSGELARVMLALKAVLADLDAVPVLVFDEVDANVGGEIGRVVGEKMAAIGRSRQVVCVTHLPQVAAQGDFHLVVEKDQTSERAVVSITPIEANRKRRVGELARMLGDRSAKSALAHAEELLRGRS
ncbi:MAG: AAA family ATPase [Opitutaceae bacterium]|nr:AAA family ATPase [Opitutaceae bacterium]